MIGVNFLFSRRDFGSCRGALFFLYVPLTGLLIWERRSAQHRRERLTQAS